MDDADAGLSRCDRVRERDLASVDSNPAGVRLVGAAEDLDQRRLSGAVFAAERVDLAPCAAKGEVVKRLDARKRVRDVAHLEGERGGLHPDPPDVAS
jgi:hypothetical protein